MFSDIFQIISVKCSNASKYIFQVRKLEKLVFFTATMTVFLKLGKIKIFSCNAFTILNVTKLCILEKQKLTKKDHGQQWPKVSYYVVTFYLFHLFYSLLGANCEEHLAYLRTKSVPRYNFFCSSFGILFILRYILPSQHLLDQSQQWKHKTNVWNLFKVNYKDTRTTSSFWCFYY